MQRTRKMIKNRLKEKGRIKIGNRIEKRSMATNSKIIGLKRIINTRGTGADMDTTTIGIRGITVAKSLVAERGSIETHSNDQCLKYYRKKIIKDISKYIFIKKR